MALIQAHCTNNSYGIKKTAVSARTAALERSGKTGDKAVDSDIAVAGVDTGFNTKSVTEN